MTRPLAAALAILVALVVAVVLTLRLALPAHASDCHEIPVTWWSPTGVAGCTVYGIGTASMWQGPGAARNDCEYPWTSCTPITVRSMDTGLQIIVVPSMFCDCYTGTADERIVDLDPDMVAALGLHAEDGLWRVEVQPWTIPLPDTATDVR